MAGYSGISMSNNAVDAYAKGKKPFSQITKEDILKYGINESVSFFRWYVKSYCPSCEWHHTSPKYNQTTFYDLEQCCNSFKNAEIDKLKIQYKNQLRSKPDNRVTDKPYYALVEYSISTYTGKRKYFTTYAVINRCWAYIKDDYRGMVIKKKIGGKHFRILEQYESRPEKMPEEIANAIMEKISEY